MIDGTLPISKITLPQFFQLNSLYSSRWLTTELTRVVIQINKYQKKISTATWRKKFLHRFDKINDLDIVIDVANSRVLPKSLAYKTVVSKALLLVHSYPKSELAWARSHYNTRHMVSYWRWYNDMLGQWKNEFNLDQAFPVFSVDPASDTYSINGFTPDEIAARSADYITPKDYTIINGLFPGIHAFPELLSTFGLLVALHNMVKASFIETYQIFLNEQKKKNNDIWRYYRVHKILDSFLYVRSDGDILSANFSSIFFSTNMFNIFAFLFHKISNNEKLCIRDIEQLLDRQRKYLSKLAVTNTLAETEVLNFCKNMHYYDSSEGLVKVGISDHMLQKYQKERVDDYDRKSLEGCPFAQTRGVKTTAFMEVFEHFDNIMLHFLQTQNLLPGDVET